MKSFEYNEYLIKGCIVPLIVTIVALSVTIISLLFLIKTYRRIIEGQIQRTKSMPIALLCILLLVVGVTTVSLCSQTLKYSIKLIGEDERDAQEIVTRIEKIDPISISPCYVIDGNYADKSAEVLANGVIYYFMSSEKLNEGQIVRIRYLPNSKIVLAYSEADESELLDYLGNSGEKIFFDPVFCVMIIIVSAVFGLIAKDEFFSNKKAQKILADDLNWDKNEIRFHKSEITDAMIISTICAVVGVLISFIFNDLTIIPFLFILIIAWISISFGKQKLWRLEYNEKELIYCSEFGRKEVIPVANIISIVEKFEEPFWARGSTYRIIKIIYRPTLTQSSMYRTIKLDFRCHVGIRHFCTFMGDNNALTMMF